MSAPLLTGRHIMLDGETLGLSKNSVFLQIGGVEFFPETGELGGFFNQYIQIGSSLQVGRTLDPETLLWWMDEEQVSNEARQRLVKGLRAAEPLQTVLLNLVDFIQVSNGRRGLGQRREKPEGVWSHGVAFDVAGLEETYAMAGLKCPWGHRTPLDTRTIFRLADFSLSSEHDSILARWPETAPPHVLHDGLSDAIYQAIGVMDAAKKLKRVA